MCQVHKILKKCTVTFQIIKNTLQIALCYVQVHEILKKYLVTFQIINNSLVLCAKYIIYWKNTQ